MNGDIEATATLEVGGATYAVEHAERRGDYADEHAGCHGQHRDDRDAVCGRHACRHHQGAVRERRCDCHRMWATVGGAMTLSDTLDVSGVTTLSNTVKLPTTYSFLTHTAGTAGALKISSDLGYVEVEDIRFIGNSIGVNGAADLIGLTSSDVTLKGDLKINDGTNDMFAVSVLTGDTQVGGALHVASDLNVGSGPTFQVTASDGSLAIGSNVFTVSGTSGNTKTLGKLAVNGAAPSLPPRSCTSMVILKPRRPWWLVVTCWERSVHRQCNSRRHICLGEAGCERRCRCEQPVQSGFK